MSYNGVPLRDVMNGQSRHTSGRWVSDAAGSGTEIKPGREVTISDTTHAAHGQTGTVTRADYTHAEVRLHKTSQHVIVPKTSVRVNSGRDASKYVKPSMGPGGGC